MKIIFPHVLGGIFPKSLCDNTPCLPGSSCRIPAGSVPGFLDPKGGPYYLLASQSCIARHKSGMMLQGIRISKQLRLHKPGTDMQKQGSLVLAGMACGYD